MIQPVPFAGATYAGRSRSINAQRCVNWYPEVYPQGQADKTQMALLPTPGLKLWTTIGGEPIRGLHVIQQGSSSGAALYVVSGDKLYSVNSAKTATLLGTLNTGSGVVSMADNGTDLVICDGAYQSSTAEVYVWETDNTTLNALNDSTDAGYDADAPRATNATFLDGYILLNKINTGQMHISDVNDATTWTGTYATAESAPDNLVSILAHHKELWAFGENTTEVWYDSGAAGFPLDPIPGAIIEYGCAAPRSVAKDDVRVYWLGKNKQGQFQVVANNGYQVQVISNPMLEYQFSQYNTFTDAHAFCYFQEGHTFYVLTFPTENKTWVFDVSTGMWHERESTGHNGRWIPSCHVFCFNKNLVGDYSTGKIYELDLDTYTDNGTVITRKRVTQHLHAQRMPLFVRSLEVEFEPGVGLTTGQGSDPQAMLRWSDDGGFTWSNEHWVSIGKIGAYKNRAKWRKLGRARDRVWELTVSDPVRSIVVNAVADLSVGRA